MDTFCYISLILIEELCHDFFFLDCETILRVIRMCLFVMKNKTHRYQFYSFEMCRNV